MRVIFRSVKNLIDERELKCRIVDKPIPLSGSSVAFSSILQENFKLKGVYGSFVKWAESKDGKSIGIIAEVEIDLANRDENGLLAYGKILSDLKNDFLFRHPEFK